MNVFTFTGALGKDCRTATVSGTEVANFAVAVNSGYGDRKETVWVECAYWGKGGAAVSPYLTKGAKVCVSGELSQKDEGEYGKKIHVRVNSLTLIGSKGEGGSQQSRQEPRHQAQPESFDDASDLPF